MKHKKSTTIIAAAMMLVAPAAAQAGTTPVTPDVFGNGGGDPAPLSATCQRLPVHIPFGRHWLTAKPGVISAFTIIDTELKCVTFHLEAVGNCWEPTVPVVAEAPADKQGYHDETGAKQLSSYLQSVRGCILNATGVGAP